MLLQHCARIESWLAEQPHGVWDWRPTKAMARQWPKVPTRQNFGTDANVMLQWLKIVAYSLLALEFLKNFIHLSAGHLIDIGAKSKNIVLQK